MEPKNIKKLYYSISEVSQITSLKKYVLRYWESEFPELRPEKNRAGNRIYRLTDIKTIFLIKKLLYQDKYTIEGAKKKLRELKKNKESQLQLSFEDMRRQDALLEIRKGLQELLDFIDNKPPEEEKPPGEDGPMAVPPEQG
ncbi:MAG: MerR family transcriptional regulator [Calditrichaeota bacterium]|nr:MAG: MerR family transcriptional regulator [Calditrichota bacterium]